jgi:hypothetical protein
MVLRCVRARENQAALMLLRKASTSPRIVSDCIAAGRQHFRACIGCQRMIADHHAAAPGRRPLLTFENRWLRDPANDPPCCFPVSCCGFHRAHMHRPAVFARMTTIP